MAGSAGGFLSRFFSRVSLYAKTTEAANASSVPNISQLKPLLSDDKGVLFVNVLGTGQVAIGNEVINTDTEDNPGIAASQLVSGAQLLYNGTTDDDYARQRNNNEETILASAARTASVDSADFTNFNGNGAHFVIDVSAITATPSIVVTIQGKDLISSNYYDILVGAAITTVGTTILKVYPGINGLANAIANDILPRIFRVSVANADADSITYSISAALVL